jgi:UPF0755 protein
MNTTPQNQFGHRAMPPSAAPPSPPPPGPAASKPASEALQPRVAVPPPRRSRGSRNQFVVFLNLMVSAAMILVLAAGAAVWLGKRAFDAPGPATAPKTVLIKPRTGASDIAEQLQRQGLISSSWVFYFFTRVYGADDELKAGEYAVDAGASMRDLMELLKSGKSVSYALTIPEGFTVAQAWQRIAGHEALSGDMPGTVPVEGSLVADTQPINRGMTRKAVVEKMLADQKQLVESIWARRAPDLPLADISEFVTLASIVEKETGRSDERSRVAAVFINRLNRGMRLQSDPTIIYGLFGGRGRPADRPIYQSDIEKPTPYNTYVIDGLPPTPIANPGRAALEAVANPSQTGDLYFVADGAGGHVFAATLEEHNKNVARWRQLEKKRAEEAAKAAADAGAEGADAAQ